jgi:probable rRNA maturation factor
MTHFTLASNTQNLPKHQYAEMKEVVLGKKYDVTLAFVSPKKAQALNVAYRKKDYIPNVLSFPLTHDTGEVYICLSIAKKECKKFGMTYEEYVGYLFIHALLHLRGMDHGDAMDRAEKKYCKAFTLAQPKQ